MSVFVDQPQFGFQFDIILVMLFSAYIIYGYLSGGHKQIRLSINLILPFVILYYLGPFISTKLYAPITNTLLFEVISELFGFMKYTFMMMITYILMYLFIFVGIFILSIFAKRYVLNENMRAKLGTWNNVLGAVISLVNGYVLVYFIILPAFSMNLVSTDSVLTNTVLQNPPPFSRIARTAEKAVPIKDLADKAETFQQLLSADGLDALYNDAIIKYRDQYMGGADSKEAIFMTDVYPYLTPESKALIDQSYQLFFGVSLSPSSYFGVSVALTHKQNEALVYEEMMQFENEFERTYEENLAIKNEYEQSIAKYQSDLASYEYLVAKEIYDEELSNYLSVLEDYLQRKTQAFNDGTIFDEPFDLARPYLAVNKPEDFHLVDTSNPPLDPSDSITIEIQQAIQYVVDYVGKKDIRDELASIGRDFESHRGLLVWLSGLPDVSDISTVVVSFKNHYDEIVLDINDDNLEEQLYLARMSIQTYDVFSQWLDCTMNHIDTVSLDEIQLAQNRCDAIDPDNVTVYDFTTDAFSIVSTLFDGEAVSWVIEQFKYDYDSGIFTDLFAPYPEVTKLLSETKDLVDEYDSYYKDIATSIEGDVPMALKIGVSVMKYHIDIYDTLQSTPLMAAMLNDAARLCASTEKVPGYDVMICDAGQSSGLIGTAFNLRELIAEIYLKAYFMVDENNQKITYDSERMETYLASLNDAVNLHIISKEMTVAIADQFAFHTIDDQQTTLLDQMYEEGYISLEALRLLSDDPYGLFSDEFRYRVRSLIR
jgi:hypothetical protein